jgi:hypothetical protein
LAEGNIDVLERKRAQGPGTEVPPGSETRACTQKGSPGTWEAPWLPRWPTAVGAGVPPNEETK